MQAIPQGGIATAVTPTKCFLKEPKLFMSIICCSLSESLIVWLPSVLLPVPQVCLDFVNSTGFPIMSFAM